MACLCVPEDEFEEFLHVPLSTRRKLLLSSAVSFKNQVESSHSPGLLTLPPCSAGYQVDQHFSKEHSPNSKVTADAFEVATNEHPLDSAAVAQVSQYATSCQDVGLPINGNSQGSQADKLTGTEANADASGLEINVHVPLPPNKVPSNVSDFIKVDCADNLLSLSEIKFSASTGVIISCQDVGFPINGNKQGSQADQLKDTEADANANASGLDKINAGVLLPPNSVPSNVSAIRKVDCADNMLLSLSKGDTISSASTGFIAVNTMDKKLSDFTFDELDHIVLKERRKLLLKRKLVELEKPALEATSVGLTEDLMEDSSGRIKKEFQPIDGECMKAQNQFSDIPISASDPSSCSADGSSSFEYSTGRNKEEIQFVDGWSVGNEFNDIPIRSAPDLQRTSATGTEAARSGNRMEESNIICPSERTSKEFKSWDGDDSVPASTNNIYNSTLNTSVKVKVEPLDYNNLQNPERSTSGNMVSIKCEEDITHGMDHMLLRDRMKLTSVEEFELNSSRNFECLRKTEPAAYGFSSIVSESTEPIRVNHPRKRKKAATDSVLTALEEDAPGLLKVLLDQGVSVDEIKLYGESQNDDALDESFNEDSFSELEAVMTKTRYLHFRGWPVEWAWCRDLRSFIFVFKRHHRLFTHGLAVEEIGDCHEAYYLWQDYAD